MATNSITNTFYENILEETFVDPIQNGQMYMKTNLQQIVQPEKVKMSSFVIGADNEEGFFDEVIKKIKTLAKSSEPYLLGPVYYNKDNKPDDFQCNFTETGKTDEGFFNIANRGLIEEAGLSFKSKAKFVTRHHCITRKKSFQDCVTYLVHASQLEPVKPEICDVVQTFFNEEDYVGQKNDLNHLHKAQIFVYGTQQELDSLVQKITMKPVKKDKDNDNIVFYDDEIRGLTTFSIKRLNRFRQKRS